LATLVYGFIFTDAD